MHSMCTPTQIRKANKHDYKNEAKATKVEYVIEECSMLCETRRIL